MSFLMRMSCNTARVCRSCRVTQRSIQARYASAALDSANISKITEKEKEITGQVNPVKGGPTAQAQKHAGQQLNSQNISEISNGEKNITGQDLPVKDGPTSAAQSMLSQNDGGANRSGAPSSTISRAGNTRNTRNNNNNGASGVLDSATISKITDAEKKITGSDEPARGGPTAQAQKHAGEPISSEALSDITAGEKKVAGDRLKGGPTSTAQSELGKSRN